jgi:hypothetical protein
MSPIQIASSFMNELLDVVVQASGPQDFWILRRENIRECLELRLHGALAFSPQLSPTMGNQSPHISCARITCYIQTSID